MVGSSTNKLSTASVAKTKNTLNCSKYYGDDLSEQSILNETSDLLARTSGRIEWEEIILRTLETALGGFDCMLELVPFGSSTYGFGGLKTDFNMFINASKHARSYQDMRTFK